MSESSLAPEAGKANLPPPAESSSTPKEQRTALPPPIEIAKIAAILSRGGTMDGRAIDEAIALFLRAKVRYDELVGLTFDQVLKEVGDLALLDRISEREGPPKKLRLYPDNARVDPETQKQFFHDRLDEARSYLQEKAPYLHMRKTRSVLDTIRLYFLKTAHDHNLHNKKKIEELERQFAQAAKQRTKQMGRKGIDAFLRL